MPLRKNIAEELTLVQGLRTLSSAYEEISVMQMGQVRGQVLASRTFREGLMHVFSEVRASETRDIARMIKEEEKEKKESQRESVDAKTVTPGRSVAVLVSSSEHWSGTISQEISNYFVSLVDKGSFDTLVVMGTRGRDFVRRLRPQLTFDYLELPKFDASLETCKPLIARLRDFDKITIVYAKAGNVLDQAPAEATVSGSPTLAPEADVAVDGEKVTVPRRRTNYFFEPSLPAVLKFFDTHIFALLFRQIVNESVLSQLGSRITAMERATQNIDDRFVYLKQERLKQEREERNREQRERLAGIALWNT